MIREISKQQIELKTAHGERLVLIETLANGEYERRHLPGALLLPVTQVRELALKYLPDTSAELVVYGQDFLSLEIDEMALALASLGYHNIFVYRGGKRDWFGAGASGESTHRALATGHREIFDNSVPTASRLIPSDTAPILRSAAIVVVGYFAYRLGRRFARRHEVSYGSDEVSVIPLERLNQRIVPSAFDHASGAV